MVLSRASSFFRTRSTMTLGSRVLVVAPVRFWAVVRLLQGSGGAPPAAAGQSLSAVSTPVPRSGSTTRVSMDIDAGDDDVGVEDSKGGVLGRFKDWLLRQLLTQPPGLLPGSWESPAAAVEATVPHLFASDHSVQGNIAKIAQLSAFLYARTRPTADDVIVFNKIIHCYERLGQLDKCEEWVRRMEAEGTMPIRVTYNCLIKASRKDPARGEYWYHQMRASNFEPNIQTFNKLIENFSEKGDHDGAMRWFAVAEAHPNIQLDEVLYNTVLKVFSSNPEAAEQWVAKMSAKGLRPSLYTYNKLIDIFGQAGLQRQVEEKFEEMQREGCQPDVFTLNSIINAYHHNPDAAVRCFDRFAAHNIQPDEITFTWLVKACVHGRRYAAAAEWLTRMGSFNVAANAEFCHNIFFIYMRANLLADAEHWLGRYLAQSSVAASPLALELLQSFAHVGNVPRALHWFRFLEQRSPPAPCITAVNCVIEAHCRNGKDADAHAWLRGFSERGLLPSTQTYNSFIMWAAFSGSPKEAQLWFDSLAREKLTPDFWSFHWVIDAHCSVGDLPRALEWFDRLEAAGFRGSDATISAVLRACHTSPDKVDAWVARITKAGFRPNIGVVNSIIDVYARAGDSVKAEQYFDKATAAGLIPDIFTYGILINANAGQPERAAKWFHRMRQDGVPPNVVTYSSMIKAYATLATSASPAETVRLVGQAEEWFEQMLADGIAPSLHTFTTLIALYARAGRPEKAAGTFTRLIDAGLQPNVFTYTALIGSFAHKGELDFATKVFQRMIQRGVEPNEKTYARMLRVCLNANKPEQVVEWFRDMDARKVPRTSATTVTAIRTAGNLRQRGRQDQAALLKPFMNPSVPGLDFVVAAPFAAKSSVR